MTNAAICPKCGGLFALSTIKTDEKGWAIFKFNFGGIIPCKECEDKNE